MHRRFILIPLGLLAILVFVVIRQTVMEILSPFSSVPSIDVNFSQETSLDTGLWTYEVGNKVARYNNEQQTYTIENVSVSNGILAIRALRELRNEREYTSSRINSFGTLDVVGGKFIVVAKFPKGTGTFPAIWLRTSEPRTDGQMTAEIDIAEAQGARPGIVFVNVHTAQSVAAGENINQGMVAVPDMYESFHAYGVEWTNEKVIFTLDGVSYHEVHETIPFKLHMVINLAMGGNWAQSLSDRLKLGLPNGIDDRSEKEWVLSMKEIKYFPLKESIVK